MFYYLVHLFQNYAGTPLRLIDYTTFRAGCALLTSFILCILFGPTTIQFLKKVAVAPDRYKELVKEGKLPADFIHAEKEKTPCMGGVLIVLTIMASTVVWSNFTSPLPAVFLGTLLLFGVIGFTDDYYKVCKQDGLRTLTKLSLQTLCSLLPVTAIFWVAPENFCDFTVPFMKEPLFVMPIWMAFAFACLVIVGTSNAVNFTDGKDGLASGCTIPCAVTYGVFAYMSGHFVFANYLSVPFIPGAAEVTVLACALIGSCMGFLWFNCKPASVFMGDTGSLPLGAMIGLIAILVKQELLLVIVGGVFVTEVISVMIQVASVKLFHRKVFRCTPIHHHFEQGGWTETQIVTRFWIISILLALIGLATLKLR